MNKFNGYSKIETEMLKDEIKKMLPGLLTIVPTFANLTKANYDALIKEGFQERQALIMSVNASAKQIGLGG